MITIILRLSIQLILCIEYYLIGLRKIVKILDLTFTGKALKSFEKIVIDNIVY